MTTTECPRGARIAWNELFSVLSLEAQKEILAIKDRCSIEPEDMAKQLSITFFPFPPPTSVSADTRKFAEELRETLERLGVDIVPFEKSLVVIPLRKVLARIARILVNNGFHLYERMVSGSTTRIYADSQVVINTLRRKRIKKGISVIAVGESALGDLPAEHTASFTDTVIITVIDWPDTITEDSEFADHFNEALKLFAYHVSNIVISVSKDKWMLYNFNAAHPIYARHERFEDAVLQALIPKIASPIRPCRLEELKIDGHGFDVDDPRYRVFIDDLVSGARLFEKTELYPRGKKIDSLPFRTAFHRWIGKIHLDERSGMSYGFLARQLPVTTMEAPLALEEAHQRFKGFMRPGEDFFYDGERKLHVAVKVRGNTFVLKVPEVWVLTQRSGSNKTNPDLQRDLILLGLKDGEMYLRSPQGLKIDRDYKPSFDTRVILAHAVGNALVAQIQMLAASPGAFSQSLRDNGMSISHWHGYFHPAFLPGGWWRHGLENPHVACSSPQSAVYALAGKLNAYRRSLEEGKEFLGDIHIEPHHGTNMVYSDLSGLAAYLLAHRSSVSLGNRFLNLYEAVRSEGRGDHSGLP